jgi:hypothetical protein
MIPNVSQNVRNLITTHTSRYISLHMWYCVSVLIDVQMAFYISDALAVN